MQSIFIPINPSLPEKYSHDIQVFLSAISYAPIWQTVEWNLMLEKTGYIQNGYFAGIYETSNLVAFAILEKRSIGLKYAGLFSLGGPLWKKEKNLEALLDLISQETKKDPSLLFAQIEPLTELPRVFSGWKNGAHKKFIESYTNIIDLTQTEDQILATMKPKGRYNIKVAEKHGILTEWVTSSQANIRKFYHLLSQTTERDCFATNNLTYFIIFCEYLEKYHLGGLLFATKGDELLAAGIFTFFEKTALYYYGASITDPEKRKFMASYVLQWEAIQEAKRRGCVIYDFLGIAPENQPKHHLAGVTDFKLKLSPTTQKWPDARIHITKPWKYRLFMFIKKLKNLGR